MSSRITPKPTNDTRTALPGVMRAVVLTSHGGLDRLSFRDDWPRPHPEPGQVRIEIDACGLNNTDVDTRTAWYSACGSGATTGEAL